LALICFKGGGVETPNTICFIVLWENICSSKGETFEAHSVAFGSSPQLFDLNILNIVMFCYMSQDKKKKKERKKEKKSGYHLLGFCSWILPQLIQ
jgi:hypothetical protein